MVTSLIWTDSMSTLNEISNEKLICDMEPTQTSITRRLYMKVCNEYKIACLVHSTISSSQMSFSDGWHLWRIYIRYVYINIYCTFLLYRPQGVLQILHLVSENRKTFLCKKNIYILRKQIAKLDICDES